MRVVVERFAGEISLLEMTTLNSLDPHLSDMFQVGQPVRLVNMSLFQHKGGDLGAIENSVGSIASFEENGIRIRFYDSFAGTRFPKGLVLPLEHITGLESSIQQLQTPLKLTPLSIQSPFLLENSRDENPMSSMFSQPKSLFPRPSPINLTHREAIIKEGIDSSLLIGYYRMTGGLLKGKESLVKYCYIPKDKLEDPNFSFNETFRGLGIAVPNVIFHLHGTSNVDGWLVFTIIHFINNYTEKT